MSISKQDSCQALPHFVTRMSPVFKRVKLHAIMTTLLTFPTVITEAEIDLVDEGLLNVLVVVSKSAVERWDIIQFRT